MAIRIVRLGSPRLEGEGVRLGTVRRPPRGVPKTEFAKRDFYDVWLPQLSPSLPLMKAAQAAQKSGDERDWQAFVRQFRKELATPDAAHALDLLSALSQQTDLAIGCYCEDEAHCHRSVLRALLSERGAKIVG